MGSLGIDDAVAAARGGDDAAFERLVRETYAGVFTLAARITGNRDDAADVAQEAYIRAYRGLVDVRGESRFTTWLHRITVNCANTLLVRRNANLSDANEHDLPDGNREYHPEHRVDDGEIDAEIKAALEALPISTRAVVVLSDIYDLSHAEIGKQLGVSTTVVKVRLHRGRKRMRNQLAGGLEPVNYEASPAKTGGVARAV